VAFLKWMSSIDTNGFPANFKPIDQSDAPAAAPVAESAAPVADPAASAGVSPAAQQ
jgi:nitric oxide reductase subunit C